MGFVVLAGVGLASLRLTHPVRLTLMWLVELAIVLVYAGSGKLRSSYTLLNLGRGLLVGIVVSLPLYLAAPDFFYATASRLYGIADLQVLLERAVFIVPLVEGLYFRGAVQRERGLVTAAVLYGLAQGLIVISAADSYLWVVVAVVLGMIVAGLLYGYVFKRHGLTASIACHTAVSFMLFVFPALAMQVSGWLV
jgi:membrane protease YdiL (CAAX protease family)